MIRIRCVVERITFQNPENGYTVLKAAVKGYDVLVTVVGNLLDANVGSVLLIEGNWKVDSKYGRQFMAETWEETLPATVYGIEKYLGSGLIKGVGPHFAKKIVALFGTDTIQIIEDSPDRLIEVQGIGKKRVAQIKESWEKQKEVKNIMLFLQGNGVSTSFAAKIYKAYGNESIDTVKENPFRLADDIWGIGFKTADTIAEKLGFQKTDYVRCRSGIMYTLNALADEGHVYSKRDQLIEKAVELLDADSETLERTVDKMIEDHDLVYEGDAIVMPILMTHYVMLQRNLVYTGITRAKKILVLVGTQKALNYAVRNVTVTSRNTKLCERLGGKDTEQQREFDTLFNRLALSDFRSRFKLDDKDIQLINEKGIDVIRSHAVDFVQKRLAPAVIPNDGKQTPMRGHPVFKAQHATACCCRGCLSKWHHIPAGVELTKEQQEYVVNVLMEWIGKKL